MLDSTSSAGDATVGFRQRLCQLYALPLLVAVLAFGAGEAAQPKTFDMAGQRLPLKSQATRSKLFGTVELYRVALYAPHNIQSVADLRGVKVPKGLHVAVLYGGSLPDQIPSDWRKELQPALTDEQWKQLQSAYAKLRPKDEIRIWYAPGQGTTVSVSGKPVLSVPGQGLMGAFLDIWLGQTPVSEEIKKQLSSF